MRRCSIATAGGRRFSRNVERLLKERGNRKCVIKAVAQTGNKKARILTSSAWVGKHVFMPRGWKQRFPEFAKQLPSYQKKGKNKHDDVPDTLAAIYKALANPNKSEFRVRSA
ncbi:phage terminase large subunit [Arthrobacter sp. NPDC057259]|uniref:phage terminase large subunit n=1 Tax=Arthrobacter sp. NPDC057259 TaxID=3346073 RepID=UPI003629FC01